MKPPSPPEECGGAGAPDPSGRSVSPAGTKRLLSPGKKSFCAAYVQQQQQKKDKKKSCDVSVHQMREVQSPLLLLSSGIEANKSTSQFH
ncbi:Hypothetical protein SMAX5B_011715 [Scophthalmus maximus]|uniref:Uncharacterized protein n=1 Tax=Scophthalmus maximus TaxID=52904 RepID=A0A2U9AY89_SCOMX|nr:Hypothetical protein SMAX5B_011715 [Scophthalmus maximus]KAF0045424.1 hypothetical protein F2P81_001953 [Scophthalmus maximus]